MVIRARLFCFFPHPIPSAVFALLLQLPPSLSCLWSGATSISYTIVADASPPGLVTRSHGRYLVYNMHPYCGILLENIILPVIAAVVHGIVSYIAVQYM